MTAGMAADPSTVVLLDWNGTVVQDHERARSALNGVLRVRGLPTLEPDAFTREFRLPMAAMFRRLGAPDTADAEAEWNEGMAVAPAEARAGVGALRSLAHRGVRLGVVSAARVASVGNDMVRLGLESIWDSVDLGVADKTAVLQARRGDEKRAFYLGDTVYDMQCAVASGFTPIAVFGGYTPADALTAAGATHAIGSFDELADVIIAGDPPHRETCRPAHADL